MIKTIYQEEVTFEILRVHLVRSKDQEWFEITVKTIDQYGTRETIVRQGDVLKAVFEAEERDDTCSRKPSRTKTSMMKKLAKISSSIFRKQKS